MTGDTFFGYQDLCSRLSNCLAHEAQGITQRMECDIKPKTVSFRFTKITLFQLLSILNEFGDGQHYFSLSDEDDQKVLRVWPFIL